MNVFRTFFLFGVSGAIGFVVDTGTLYLVKGILGLYFGRVASFLCAVLATWFVNRNITFGNRHSGLSKHREFSRYLVLMLGGGLVNYSVYAALIGRFVTAEDYPVIAVAAGSLAGMTINLVSSRFLLYRFPLEK
jgi:putative flippase GtrA